MVRRRVAIETSVTEEARQMAPADVMQHALERNERALREAGHTGKVWHLWTLTSEVFDGE